jgi:hypothetical protein
MSIFNQNILNAPKLKFKKQKKIPEFNLFDEHEFSLDEKNCNIYSKFVSSKNNNCSQMTFEYSIIDENKCNNDGNKIKGNINENNNNNLDKEMYILNLLNNFNK